MKKFNLKNKRGITLVALVITIIILLILAGISISTLINSGLFERAREAEETSKNAQDRENSILSQYENIMNEYLSGNVENTKPQGPKLSDTADTKPASAQPAESTIIESDLSKGIVIKDKNENE